MALLESVFLADFAQVRQNLLNVVGAGITRVLPLAYPTQLTAYVGGMVYIPPDELERVVELRIRLMYVESVTDVLRVVYGMQFDGEIVANPGEGLHLPFAHPLLGAVFAEAGQIDLSVAVNDQPGHTYSFWLLPAPVAASES